MFGDGPGEQKVPDLSLCRRALGGDLQLIRRDPAIVAVLAQISARNLPPCEPGRGWVGQSAGGQQAQVLLGFKYPFRCLIRIRGDDDLGEDLDDLFRRCAIQRLVQCDDAAKG